MRFIIIMVAHLFLVGGDFMHKSRLIILVSNVLFTFWGGVGGVQKKMMSLHKLTFGTSCLFYSHRAEQALHEADKMCHFR